MDLGFDKYLDQEVAKHFRDWEGECCEDCGKPLYEDYYETYDGSHICFSCAISLACDYIEEEHEGEEHDYELCDVYEDEVDQLLEEWHRNG